MLDAGYAPMLDKWLNNTPADERVSTVERVLVQYFGPECVRKTGGSHQFRIKHPGLAGLPGFETAGHLKIPVKNGRRVKGYYLKRIAQAIRYLQQTGDEED